MRTWIVLGILQELFQWFTQDQIVPATVVLRSSEFDLWIDWLGGLLGIMGLYRINRKLGRLLPQAKQG